MGILSPLLQQSSKVVASRGEGVYLYDTDDRRYLDFTAGIGVTSTGHCHPKVVEAVRKQAGEVIHAQYTTVRHQPLLRLVEKLGERAPQGLDAFFFASAGTESVEAALRLVRQATGRPNVIVFQGSFHGRTMGSVSMTTSKTAIHAGIGPHMGGVSVAPFPYAYRYGWDPETASRFCLRELDNVLATLTAPQETAALFIEPVQGEGGFVPATTTFMQGLRERCDRYGMLLVADEIQSGVGRTGRFWAHEHFDVRPDIFVTGKGLASGFPLSGFGASEELMSRGWPGSQGGTYGGNAVACAAALATLEVIEEEGLVQQAREMGGQLRSRLSEIAEKQPAIGDVRGLGLMVACEIVDDRGVPDGAKAKRILEEAESRGLLLLLCGAYGHVVRFIPALVVNRDQVEEAARLFAEAVEAA